MLRLGVVANEFFDRSLGRMGGFGFAARQVIRLLHDDPSLGVEVIVLPGEPLRFPDAEPPTVHGARAIPFHGRGLRGAHRLRRAVGERPPHLLLTIDYRPSYQPILLAYPRTPAVIWVRDPRTDADIQRVDSLRLPDGSSRASGRGSRPSTAARCAGWTGRRGRPGARCTTPPSPCTSASGSTAPTASSLAELHLLPNIVPPPEVPIAKSGRPSVLFLGRLDPIKRPWLFFDLAERFPDVDFLVAGQPHGSGPTGWEPSRTPPNLRRLGHLEGRAKAEVLASSWLLVNTSVHEAVAFSFFEALSYRTPIVSCQDGGGVVSRFGALVEWTGGDGRDSLDSFEVALRRLLSDGALRERLAGEGERWVSTTHSAGGFLAMLGELSRRSGLSWAPPAPAATAAMSASHTHVPGRHAVVS